MIKSKLIQNLCGKYTSIPEKDIGSAVNRLLDYMTECLVYGQRIEIRGFGSFSLHYRAPRNAHNPKTGEKVLTKAKYSPHFKPGKEMRLRVDESRVRGGIIEDEDDMTGDEDA